jgi:hypothetical protein
MPRKSTLLFILLLIGALAVPSHSAWPGQYYYLAGISILTRGLDSHQHPAARKRKVHAWVFVQVLCTVPQRANSASR